MEKPKLKSLTLDQVEADYFRKHPEEIDDYINEIFEEYALSRDAAALLSSLRMIAQVKGVSDMAAQIGLTRQGLKEALSPKGNPRFENISAVMHAFGYQLMPQKIDGHVS